MTPDIDIIGTLLSCLAWCGALWLAACLAMMGMEGMGKDRD